MRDLNALRMSSLPNGLLRVRIHLFVIKHELDLIFGYWIMFIHVLLPDKLSPVETHENERSHSSGKKRIAQLKGLEAACPRPHMLASLITAAISDNNSG